MRVNQKSKDEIKRLKDDLFTFIERVVHEPTSDKEVEILPQIAHELKEILMFF